MGMGKDGLTSKAAAADTWLSHAERVWKFLGLLGITGNLSGVSFVALAAWYWAAVDFFASLPWYVLILVALLFAALVLHVWNRTRIAWSVRGLRSLSVPDLGNECVAYYQDYSQFMVDRRHASPSMRPYSDIDSPEAIADYQKLEGHRAITNSLFVQRFVPRLLSITSRLESFGIPVEKRFHLGAEHSSASIYVGIVGNLLVMGQLAEARKLDPEMAFGASFH